ncbi:unnamed protein product [Blepharisma stoltei]|uniref:SAM domain-containing protein n=1 Tax=Blepharisma stoltei TaxID=1481888 RepID=A0AAU9JV45_9CILI|nr:unnamed protein product [Blepharisma stoltei]
MESASIQEIVQKGCRLGDIPLLKEVFKSHPQFLNQTDTQLGWTPLYRTVICGHESATRLLLNLGADPDVKSKIGETPLHQAAYNSQYSIAKLLLDYKANPNAQQNDGDTPLHHAAFKGDFSMAKLLLKYNSSPNIPNTVFGRTPLHYAVDYGHSKIVKLFIKHNAVTDIEDIGEKTPMDLTTNTDMISILLKSKEPSELASSIDNSFNSISSIDANPNYSQQFNSKFSFISQTSNYNYEKGLDLYEEKTDKYAENTEKTLDVASIPYHGRSVSSLFEPDAEKSYSDVRPSNLLTDRARIISFGGNDKKSALYSWISSVKLEGIFDTLISGGYDDLGQMIASMKTSLPITERMLSEIGIKKPGLRRRLLAALDEEAKSFPKKGKTQESNPFQCWAASSSNTGLINLQNLKQWLEKLNLSHLHKSFVDAGYDDMEHNLALMNSSWFITDDILLNDIKITKPGHRHRILSKLKEECIGFETMKKNNGRPSFKKCAEGLIIEKSSTSSACGMCLLM